MVACGITSLGAQQPNPLNKVLAHFASEKQAVEATQLATYADQLEALRQNLVSQQNTVAAGQVAAEYKSVIDRLNALQAKATEVKTKTEKTMEDGLEAIFGGAENPVMERPTRAKGTAILRPSTAKLSPEGLSKQEFWKHAQASQQWTLTDLAPGKYKVRLEFRAEKDQSGGTGQLELSGNSTPIPFRILSQDDDGKKIQSQDISLLEIEKCPVDLTIRVTGLAKADDPLFNLVAVWVQPVTGADDPAPQPRPPEAVEPKGETPRKKVDF